MSFCSLRRLLHLPSAADLPNQSYEDFADEQEVCSGLEQLAYVVPINWLVEFRLKHLLGIWNSFFGILLRCLLAQVTGFDKTKAIFLWLFHAFCFGRNVDYTNVFWTELLDLVDAKYKRKARSFIPYVQFLQLLVATSMRSFPEIHRRPMQNAYIPPKHQFEQQVETPGAHPMPIPLPLLEVADQSYAEVAAYRATHYLAMGPQEPRIPTPVGSPKRGKARGELSEQVRGTSVGRGSPSADSERTVSDIQDTAEPRGSDDDNDDYQGPPASPINPSRVPRCQVSKVRFPAHLLVLMCAPLVRHKSTMHILETSHSIASQQVVVSSSHGDIAHTLPEVHSEPQSI